MNRWKRFLLLSLCLNHPVKWRRRRSKIKIWVVWLLDWMILDDFDTRLSNFRIKSNEKKREAQRRWSDFDGEANDGEDEEEKKPTNSINRALSNRLDEVERDLNISNDDCRGFSWLTSQSWRMNFRCSVVLSKATSCWHSTVRRITKKGEKKASEIVKHLKNASTWMEQGKREQEETFSWDYGKLMNYKFLLSCSRVCCESFRFSVFFW